MSRLVPVIPRGSRITVRPPGSKSETIRALAVAALAEGRSHLYGALQSDDTVAMRGALRAWGIEVDDGGDPWTVDGGGGRFEPPKTPIDLKESGLSARILMAMAANTAFTTAFTGSGRLPERPMNGLIEVLEKQGVEITGSHIPLEVTGHGHLWGGDLTVDCSESSQFATAMMIVAPLMRESCRLRLDGLVSSAGYLDITAAVMRRFGAEVERTVTGLEIGNTGYRRADVSIEPDASAAVYPMCIAAASGGSARIDGLGRDSLQPDIKVAEVLEMMGARLRWMESSVEVDATGTTLQGVHVDMSDAPDGSLAVAVLCSFAASPSRITGLESLRLKESDRLSAISQEMTRLGGDVTVDGDSLLIRPAEMHGGSVDSHGDHRIAMSMAIAGVRVQGVEIETPEVVNKTWPGFWAFLESIRR